MSVKLIDIYNFVDTFAPYNTQCEWDNSGITVGSKNSLITKIGFALDVTSEVIDSAVKNNCDLIFTHHPAIFNPIGNIEESSPIYKAIKNKINLISAHTNFDKADIGVNTVLCDILEIKNAVCLSTGAEADVCRIGDISPVSAKELADIIAKKLNTSVSYNNYEGLISKVAVCSGAGGEYVEIVKEYGAEAFITGEAKHHEYLAANEKNIAIFCAGHYETEAPAMIKLKEIIEKEFSNIECVMLDESKPTLHTGV